MVQPDLTAWYRVTNKMDARLRCVAIGCILYAELTDGARNVCGQHATAIALTAPVVLRALHEPRSHIEEGVCVFCGGQEWDRRLGVFACVTCYPPDLTPGAPHALLDIATFPIVTDPALVKGAPHIQSDPITPEEQARSDQFYREFRAWRKRVQQPS